MFDTLVWSSPDRAVRALSKDIELCSSARHFTHTGELAHLQFKTVTSYVIKNKTKKNNVPNWDNRTSWDKRMRQCITRWVCTGSAIDYHPILGGIEIHLTLHPGKSPGDEVDPLGDSSPPRTEISLVKLSFVKILGLNKGGGSLSKTKNFK